jgi:L-ascorbate metabolism protein UlaG (beta-lactamase superfamily)
VKVTYYGHSCFLVEVAGTRLLFDPFITPNELAKDIDVAGIQADYIFLSHGHEDHVADLLPIAKRTNATVVATWEIYVWLGKQGITNAHPMNAGGSWSFDFGSVKMIYAHHSSSLPDGSYAGSAGGFVISAGGETFYYSGDTALFSDMKLIPERFKLDVTFFPIGSNFTMDVEDAIQAAKYVQCHKVIGMHYDTFGFIVINHEEAIKKFKDAGLELTLMRIGESRDVKANNN